MVARAGRDLAALLALVVLLGGILSALTRPAPSELAFALDSVPTGVTLRNFYGPERNAAGGYRWAKADSTIGLPIDRPGRYRIALTLGDTLAAPPQRPVTIVINGEPSLQIALQTTPQTVILERQIAPGVPLLVGWDEVRIGLLSDPFIPQGDERALGPLVVGIAIAPLPSSGMMLLGLFALPLALLSGAYGALRLARLRVGVVCGILGITLVIAGVLAFRDRALALALLGLPMAYPQRAVIAIAALGVGFMVARNRRSLLDWCARAVPFLRPLAYAVPAAQVVILLGLIWTHTHHVPYIDEWETVKLVRHFRDGELLFRDFYYFHNEHRLVIPRAIHLLLIELTNWNRQVEMTVNLALVVATAALFHRSLRRNGGSALATALLIPFSLILFSFAQYENLLFAFQTNFILAVFGGACCVWGLTEDGVGPPPDRRRFVIAILGACIASLSTFGGLMTWIAFLPVVARLGRWRLGAWCAIAVSIIGPYLIGFTDVIRPAREASTGALGRDPSLLVRFALAVIGGPLGYPDSTRAQIAALSSIVLLAVNLLIYWRYRGNLAPLAAWLGLALYGLGCMAVTTLGRAQSGIGQAMISRYQSFSAPWWFAFCAIAGLTLAHLLRQPALPTTARIVVRVNAAAAVLAGVCLLATNAAGWRDGLRWPTPTLESERCVIEYRTAPDSCLDPFFPSAPWFVRIQADYLQEQRLGIFGAAGRDVSALPPPIPVARRTGPYDPARLTPMDVTTALSIDGIGDLSATWDTPRPLPLAAGAPLTLTGWAVDVLRFAPARGVFFTIDGTRDFPAEYGQSRYDVARLLGHKYAASGFQVTIPTEALPPGAHTLAIKIVTDDGLAYYTPLHTQPLLVR